MIFLSIIYITYISLGLPDSLLGSAWPAMQGELGAPLAAAGVVSMLVTAGTIVSSLASGRLIARFGTGKVTLGSVALTALALFGSSMAPSLLPLCLCAVPMGLGAGAVDAALNAFAAVHYSSRHMSFLHCFWGLGATAGPILLSGFLAGAGGWRMGYRVIALAQAVVVLALACSLPLWRSHGRGETQTETCGTRCLFGLPGVRCGLAAFFCYYALESTTGLWGASYLVQACGLSADTAAQWVSLFYLGITLGRLLSGCAAGRLSSRQLIRLGLALVLLGGAGLLRENRSFLEFFLIGLGCAPVYPCLLHETPRRFGERSAQALMGVQMAAAYLGSTLAPPAFGVLAAEVSAGLLPVCLLGLALVCAFSTERLNRLYP